MAKFENNKYILRSRKAIENYIYSHSLAEVREFIRVNGVVEEDDGEFSTIYRDRKFLRGRTYDMRGESFRGDEFFITKDGRVFMVISLNEEAEIVE